MTAQVAADLRAAADVLERDGWHQGYFVSDDGCYCVGGALAKATGATLNEALFSDRWFESIEVLCRLLGKVTAPVQLYRWNDAPGRTATEVIAALRAAADRAEAVQ